LHQLIGTANEEHTGMAQIIGVVFTRNQIHTGRRAALDLVLQAGARAVVKYAVFALANAKGFLQKIEAVAHSADIGKRPKILAAFFLGAAMKTDTGKFLATGNKNIGVGFIVAQQN